MISFKKILPRGFLLWLWWAAIISAADADISVRDDTGKTIVLTAPAQRVISLVPYITELLYAAGAGNTLVGAVDYSDYPPAAKSLPRVGSGAGLDIEGIVALHPDLVVAWQSGNPAWQVANIGSIGIPVFITEPRKLDDVAGLLERFGQLTGASQAGIGAAREFRRDVVRLRARYSGRPPVTVFYQLLDSSLITVNGRHLISDVIRLCGGTNIFAEIPVLVPRIDLETVLLKNPQAILASGYEPLWPEWRDRWRRWPTLAAVEHENLFLIPADLIERQSPRILEGVEWVCQALDRARTKRSAATIR